METSVDLSRYPLHRPGSPDWTALVEDSKAKLARDGLFNLPGFLKAEAVQTAVDELQPVIDSAAFNHAREHNIYFKKSVEGLPDDHPALRRFRTTNHTICADQMADATVIRLYE